MTARMGRAQCLVIRDNAVLMVQTNHLGRVFWCLPGGGIERGETPAEAAVRELHEECRLQGVVVRETAITTYCVSPEDRHHTFLMDIGTQGPSVGFDPEYAPEAQEIVSVGWRTLRQLSEKDRAFLWTAGLISIAPFADEALSWPDEAFYPLTGKESL